MDACKATMRERAHENVAVASKKSVAGHCHSEQFMSSQHKTDISTWTAEYPYYMYAISFFTSTVITLFIICTLFLLQLTGRVTSNAKTDEWVDCPPMSLTAPAPTSEICA